MSVEQGVIMWGHRVVVPSALRTRLLEEVHSTHMGIVKSKAMVRSYFWWPGINSDVENFIKACKSCRLNQSNPKKVEISLWPESENSFERIHIDYCGPIKGKYLLVIVDSHSKWLEVFPMNSMISEVTIENTGF